MLYSNNAFSVNVTSCWGIARYKRPFSHLSRVLANSILRFVVLEKLFLCVAHLVRFSRVRPEDSHCITILSSTRASRTLQIYVARNDCRQWSIITETVHDKRICNDFRFDLICYASFSARRFYRWIALGARLRSSVKSWNDRRSRSARDRLSSIIQLVSKERERDREREFVEM